MKEMNQNKGRSETAEMEIDLRELFYLIWRRKVLLILLVVGAVLLTYYATTLIPSEYRATSQVLITEDEETLREYISPEARTLITSRNAQIYQEMLRSRTFLEQVSASLNQSAGLTVEAEAAQDEDGGGQERAESTRQDSLPARLLAWPGNLQEGLKNLLGWTAKEGEITARELRENIVSIRSGAVDNLLIIEATHTSPEAAREIANTMVSVLEDRHYQRQVSDLDRALEFISGQLEEVRGTIVSLEEEIARLEDAEDEEELAVEEPEEGGGEYSYQLNEARIELLEIQSRLDNLEALDFAGSGELAEERERLTAREAELKEEIAYYEEELADRELFAGGQQPSLSFLKSEKEIAERTYNMLRERQEETRIQKNIQPTEIEILESAILPESPVYPRRNLMIAIAAVLALMVGLGIIFLLEVFDTRIKSKEQLEALTGLPVLGVIPDIEENND